MMIQKGPMACFVQDRKGYLPIHVACSRHCSPEKLLMLLSVNPDSITARTSDGLTVLDLANRSKTVSHPNQALIEEIERRVVQSQQNPDLFRREMQEGFISLRSISTPVTQSPHTTWTPTTHNMMNNMMLVPPRGSSRVEYHNDSANISDSSDETQAQAQAQPLPVHQRLYPLAPQRTEPHDRYRYDESRQFTPIDRISHGNDIFRKRKVNRGGVSLAYSNYNNDPRCCSSSNHHHDGAHQFSVPITVTPHSSLYTSHSRLRSSEGGASAFTGYRPTRSTTTNLRPVRLFHDDDDDDDDDSSRPTIHVERDVNESSFVGTVPNNQGQYGYNSIVQARTRSPAAVVAVRRGSRSSFVTTPPPRNRVQQRSSVNGGRRMMMMVENNNNNNMNRSTESSSPAHLLLHFSQNVSSTVTDSPKRKRDIAEV
jgi:Ankyrin repeats (many copies)